MWVLEPVFQMNQEEATRHVRIIVTLHDQSEKQGRCFRSDRLAVSWRHCAGSHPGIAGALTAARIAALTIAHRRPETLRDDRRIESPTIGPTNSLGKPVTGEANTLFAS